MRWFRRRRKGKPTVRWGRKVTGLSEPAGPPNRPPQACRISSGSPDGSSSSSRGERYAWETEHPPRNSRPELPLGPSWVGPCTPCARFGRAPEVPHKVAQGDREPSGGAPRPRQGAPPLPVYDELRPTWQAQDRIPQELVHLSSIPRRRYHVHGPYGAGPFERRADS